MAKLITHYIASPIGGSACGARWEQGSTRLQDVDCRRCQSSEIGTFIAKGRMTRAKANMDRAKSRVSSIKKCRAS